MQLHNQEKIFDKELSIICYRIEIKMYETIYREIPIYETFNKYKQHINQYMEESFKYRLLSNNIISLISTWEQQLYDFFIKNYTSITNEFRILKPAYIKNQIVSETEFNKIDEYRYLANVLKHGKDGFSYDELVKINSKFLSSNPNFTYLQSTPSFNLPILNIDETTITDLCDILENFWKSIIL